MSREGRARFIDGCEDDQANVCYVSERMTVQHRIAHKNRRRGDGECDEKVQIEVAWT